MCEERNESSETEGVGAEAADYQCGLVVESQVACVTPGGYLQIERCETQIFPTHGFRKVPVQGDGVLVLD